MSAREQLFWNTTLEQLLLACPDEAAVKAVFLRLAGVPALQVSLPALSGWVCSAAVKPQALHLGFENVMKM